MLPDRHCSKLRGTAALDRCAMGLQHLSLLGVPHRCQRTCRNYVSTCARLDERRLAQNLRADSAHAVAPFRVNSRLSSGVHSGGQLQKRGPRISAVTIRMWFPGSTRAMSRLIVIGNFSP